jgi:hypothetical protein
VTLTLDALLALGALAVGFLAAWIRIEARLARLEAHISWLRGAITAGRRPALEEQHGGV